jgi:hypothetical protein
MYYSSIVRIRVDLCFDCSCDCYHCGPSPACVVEYSNILYKTCFCEHLRIFTGNIQHYTKFSTGTSTAVDLGLLLVVLVQLY